MEASVYSLDILLIVAAGTALVGVLIGIAVGRQTSSSGQKYREVERKLDQVLQDKKLYEDEVVEHFTETAQLLNTLTDSYRDVHNHLAKGAGALCQGEGPVALGQLTNPGDPGEIPANLVDVQPPLDYAPRTSPDEKGTLHEEFGIDRQSPTEAAASPADMPHGTPNSNATSTSKS